VAIALDGNRTDSSPEGLAGQAHDSWFASRRPRKLSTPVKLAADYAGVNGAPNGDAPLQAIPKSDGVSPPREIAGNSVGAGEFEPRLVKESFAHLMYEGPSTMEYFYARLFAADPDIRALFPMTMTAQRERAFAVLARLVWSLDNEPGCTEILDQLGRDHRRFGVTERHFSTFFATLRDTARHFIGNDWTPDIAAAWQGMLDFVSARMKAAAARDAKT